MVGAASEPSESEDGGEAIRGLNARGESRDCLLGQSIQGVAEKMMASGAEV